MLPDNKAIYDSHWVDWADQKRYGPTSRWLRWLVTKNLAHVDLETIQDVIDVGCGQGSTTAMLAEMLPRANVLGIDISDTGIAVAGRLHPSGNLTFIVDPHSDRLQSRRYDLVTCFEVLEHIDDWSSMLRRICAASRRYVMLSFPTGRMRSYETAVGHVRNFERGEVERFMDSCGFARRNIYYAGFPFYSPIYRDFCNLADAGNNQFASGQYGVLKRVVSSILFITFRHLSLTRVGDQFCGLFERQQV